MTWSTISLQSVQTHSKVPIRDSFLFLPAAPLSASLSSPRDKALRISPILDTRAQLGPWLVKTGRLVGPGKVGLEVGLGSEVGDIFRLWTGEEGALPAEEVE